MGGVGRIAEFMAKEYGTSREEQDELGALSHKRAVTAQSNGYFDGQIIPIEVKTGKKSLLVHKDEHPRSDSTLEALSKLPPAFSADGTVTAGNSSAINDGAAAIVLASREACKEYGLTPLAKLGPWSVKAVELKRVGIAPVPVIRQVLSSAGLELNNVGLIEINEAFASYIIACEKEMKLDRSRLNVNGSGLSLGHPVGATGTRIVVTLLHEMIRRDEKLGIASLCAGGGMGYAILLSRDF